MLFAPSLLVLLISKLSLADNWAVLIDSSRYWQNYRHASNTLGLHRILVDNGIPESNIILLLAHDYACDCRNPDPGSIWYDSMHSDLYSRPYLQVDYATEAVTGNLVLDLLTNQISPYTPRRLRLDTSPDSNVLVFLSGHSGVDFMKFQDFKELPAGDLASALKGMQSSRGFKGLLWIADTCKAESIHDQFEFQDFIAISSSNREENSYGFSHETDLGVINADQFSYHSTKYLNSTRGVMSSSIADYVAVLERKHMTSTVTVRSDRFKREISQVKLGEFMQHKDNWVRLKPVAIPQPQPLTLQQPRPRRPRAQAEAATLQGQGFRFGPVFWAVAACAVTLPIF
jgi:GPI-anchor transamidase subunit K